jgi:hypothetical protein
MLNGGEDGRQRGPGRVRGGGRVGSLAAEKPDIRYYVSRDETEEK